MSERLYFKAKELSFCDPRDAYLFTTLAYMANDSSGIVQSDTLDLATRIGYRLDVTRNRLRQLEARGYLVPISGGFRLLVLECAA